MRNFFKIAPFFLAFFLAFCYNVEAQQGTRYETRRGTGPNCEWRSPRTNSPAYHMRHYNQYKPVIIVSPAYTPAYTPYYVPRDYYGRPYGYYRYYQPEIVFGVRF